MTIQQWIFHRIVFKTLHTSWIINALFPALTKASAQKAI